MVFSLQNQKKKGYGQPHQGYLPGLLGDIQEEESGWGNTSTHRSRRKADAEGQGGLEGKSKDKDATDDRGKCQTVGEEEKRRAALGRKGDRTSVPSRRALIEREASHSIGIEKASKIKKQRGISVGQETQVTMDAA